MSVKAYKIRDWEAKFETHETRKVKYALNWVGFPTKHDGKSYRRVAAHPKSVQVFCAFVLMAEVAAKMPTRGVLSDGDGPLSADDLSAKTGFPAHIFDAAFKVLMEPGIAWLELIEINAASGNLRKSPEISGDIRKSPLAVEESGSRSSSSREDLSPSRAGEVAIPNESEFAAAFMGDGIPTDYLRRKWLYFDADVGWLNSQGRARDWRRLVRAWWSEDRAKWKGHNDRRDDSADATQSTATNSVQERQPSPGSTAYALQAKERAILDRLKQLHSESTHPDAQLPTAAVERKGLREELADVQRKIRGLRV